MGRALAASLTGMVILTTFVVLPAGARSNVGTHGKPAYVLPAPAGLLAISAPRHGALWVLAGNSKVKTLTEMNSRTGAIIETIGVSAAATDLVWLPNGYLAVSLGAGRNGSIAVYDPRSYNIIARRPLAGPAIALAVTPTGSQIYALVRRPGARSVAVVSGITMQQITSVPVDSHVVSVAAFGGNGSVLVLQNNGLVQQVGLSTSHVLAEFETGAGGRDMVIAPGTRWLFIVRFLRHITTLPGVGSNVARVNLATEEVVKVLPAPAHCVDIAISSDLRTLYAGVGTSGYGNVQAYNLP